MSDLDDLLQSLLSIPAGADADTRRRYQDAREAAVALQDALAALAWEDGVVL
jgi:hypothetical protein